MSRRRVARGRRGGYELRIPAAERELLGSLPGQLERLLDETKQTGASVDGLRRLFPVAYARDPEAQAAYAELVRGELLDHHLESLAVLAQTADSTHLSEAEAEAWLAAINDLRLVLGTSLGVEEEPVELDPADAHYGDWVCYGYLSYLQGEIVDALSGALPPPSPGADDEVPDDPWGDLPGDLRWDGTLRPNRGPSPER